MHFAINQGISFGNSIIFVLIVLCNEGLCNVRKFISVRVWVGLFTRELSINDNSIVLCSIHCLSNSIGHMSIIIVMTK